MIDEVTWKDEYIQAAMESPQDSRGPDEISSDADVAWEAECEAQAIDDEYEQGVV